ncbi:MAG TPA: FG-GAP-like repeat-containing protein [Candidatus Limnocylindrales bacterium]|nr:FG-GAP-like repeat-containing protein [Candidatus Limnocylindrales bacterium]
MFARLRRWMPGLVTACLLVSTGSADTPQVRAEAAKLNNLGVAMMNQQLMEKAVVNFDAAYKLDPSLATAALNKGIALLNQQKLPEAEAALQLAAVKEPDNPRVWYNLGLVHRGDGKTAEAITDFLRVLKIDPTDPDAYYFLGTFYSQQQDYPKAIDAFQQALKINPLHASAEFGLARALQRSGQTDEARVHLKKFEHLTRDKISSPITLTYGEQGRYSVAQDVITTDPAVGPMIPVTFVPQALAGAMKGSATASGGGVCMIDVDGDGRLDVLSIADGDPVVHVFRSLGEGKFKEEPSSQYGLALKGKGVSCAVGDYDNDGKNDLAVTLEDRVVLFHNDGGGKFSDVTAKVGITPMNEPAGLTFVDYDHDGDLDLFVTGKRLNGVTDSTDNLLWRNNGNNTFTNWTKEAGVGGTGATTAVVLSDINNDRAVDLIVTGSTNAPTVYLNQRESLFKAMPLYDAAGLSPTVGVYIFDFNKDGWMDVALTHAGAPGISLWRNVDGKRFERVPLPIADATRGWGITAVDFDNDGWIDLAVVLETSKGTELRVLRNKGAQGFEDVSAALGLNKVKIASPRAVVAADLDNDLAADLLITQLGGDPVVLHNDGGNKNHALRIDLKGLADNKTGLGTKIEVFANGTWQKFEVAGGAGYLSQGPPEVLAGLGKNTNADIVRMLWPTGVLQDEIDVAVNKPVSFLELDRRGSSCPTLFAWNGEKYEFITDVIGAGVVGHWISPTAKNTPDPDEWVKIDGSKLRAKDGYLSVRFGEPMEEVNYIDQLRMVAVDHPANIDVYPDERFLDNPPFASGKAVAASTPHVPVGAWDDHGRDVLQLLSARDHLYVRDFTNLPYAGFANTHTLTLDLGTWTSHNPLRLFLSGFIEYFSATSMYAAWQAGLQPMSPYIEAQMPDGSWKRVVDDMGFPAGLPRTITVDLTDKLPAGVRNIRITTNLQIYWDQVLVDNGPAREHTVRTTELPLAAATLGFRGYPRQVDGETPGDLTYYYEQASTTGPFSRFRGSYTQYGDVTALLTSIDNHFAVFGTGEDIDAEFDTAALPSLPSGWKRDYFFYANGFVKDMDFFEAIPFTVDEMPFHGMSAYPYPASQHYPDDSATNGYRLNSNDRFESGANRATEYRFEFAPRRIDPVPLTPSRASHASAIEQ